MAVVESAPKALRIRCKYRSGQCVINHLSSESTVEELLLAVSSAVGIPRCDITLFHGYPPKQLILTPESLVKPLHQIPLTSGDTLVVDAVQPAPVVSPPTRTSTSAPQSPDLEVKPDASHFSTPVSSVEGAGSQFLLRLCAPVDNACLFTSVLFCVSNADGRAPANTTVVTDPAAVAQTRELIANIVYSDPEFYNEGFLGMPNEQYCHHIQQPDRWGGGIEVAILSQVYEVEICILDIQTGRVDRFGEDRHYTNRILLLYDGIHYDPLALEQQATNRLKTVFSTQNDTILFDAQRLAGAARTAHQYTDTSSFRLKCLQCQVLMTGQKAAQEHANQTGHTNFGEYTP